MSQFRLAAASGGLFGVMAGALLLGSPAAAARPTEIRFAVSGGNTCEQGATHGTVSWWGYAPIHEVKVDGVVSAGPTGHSSCPPSIAGVTELPAPLMVAVTKAEYTAWSGGWLVDRERREVGNDTARVSLTLTSVAEIDELKVEACWAPDIQNQDGTIPDRCVSRSYPVIRAV
jgi:hypothetical protein